MRVKYRICVFLILVIAILVTGVLLWLWYPSQNRLLQERPRTISVANQMNSARNAKNTQSHALPATETSTNETPDLSVSKVETVIDNTYNDLPEPFTEDEIDKLLTRVDIMMAGEDTMKIWKTQDKIMKLWPVYSNIRDELHNELSRKLSLNNMSEEELLETALKFREKFWQTGGGFSQDSYRYAYRARLLLELAHDRNPENLATTDELVETIQTAHPSIMFDEETNKKVRNNEIGKTLLKLRSEQFKQIKREIYQDGRFPTLQDFIRAVDLAVLLSIYDNPSAKEVVDWLQRESDRGDWAAYRGSLYEFQSHLSRNRAFNFNIYTSTKSRVGEEPRYGRRYPSFRGPNPEERGLVLWSQLPGDKLHFHHVEK